MVDHPFRVSKFCARAGGEHQFVFFDGNKSFRRSFFVRNESFQTFDVLLAVSSFKPFWRDIEKQSYLLKI